MTTSAFRDLTTAEKIFKDLIWTPGIRAGELALDGAVPFLAIPAINFLEEELIAEVSDWMFNNLVLFVDVTAIKLVDPHRQTQYEAASLQLALIAEDKGIDSDDFIKAREAAKVDLSQFTQLSH